MPKILVIDDSKFQRKIISALLESEGFSVITAENGNSGFDLVLNESPDLVICDLLMPELDGFGFLEKIRLNNANVPVIILTSDIQNTTRKRCLDMGAFTVLNKPLAKETLLPALSQALGARRVHEDR
ncbi:MAG TPA: response regulator [Methanoregulaceae archaeon]|nr:response regulator [Methanoregulaceae archaeon]HQC13322.1 response regulator [Methanoregulaceae archaeon]